MLIFYYDADPDQGVSSGTLFLVIWEKIRFKQMINYISYDDLLCIGDSKLIDLADEEYQAIKEYKRKRAQETNVKKDSKKRGIGYHPINQPFKDSVFHHFFLGNDSAGAYIPKTLHELYPHDRNNSEQMKKINSEVFKWLAESQIIC